MHKETSTTSSHEHAPVSAPKTRIRLRTTAFAAADYAVNVLILFAYAAAGTIPMSVPATILLMATVFNLIFFGGIVSGLTLRFRDPSITGVQVTAACGINLAGILLAPEITYMFLLNLFVPLAYAVLHFSRREFLLAWILLSLATSYVLWAVGGRAGIALETDAERMILPAVIALVLGRFVAINAEVSRLRARLHQKNKALAAATTRLSEMATHDDLTGIWNRRMFMTALRDEHLRAMRTGSGFCVAIVDLDKFKQINDRFGHLTGDAALTKTAFLLRETIRATDRVARFGGEEFVVLLVDIDRSSLPIVLERVRLAVEKHDWNEIASGLRVTISTGVSAWEPGENVEQALKRADEALYEAKESGRNCFRIAPPAGVPALL